MWKTLEVAIGGVLAIGGIFAALALAGYVLWWISLLVAGRFSMIGRRHRHKDWDRLNPR
jgi:hypothetical protein